MAKAAKTVGRGRGNKTKNQYVIGASRSDALGLWSMRLLGIDGKAGQTRDIDAAFHPEGGIIFFGLRAKYLMSQCSVRFEVFFRVPLP